MPGKRHATEESRRIARLESYKRCAARRRAEKRKPDTRVYIIGDTPEHAAARKARKAEKDRLRYERTKDDEKVKAANRERDRARQQRNMQDPEWRRQRAAYFRKHYEENVDYYIARGVEASRGRRSTFHTLATEHQDQIVAFYAEARRLTEATGIPHEVDHIEPLRGKRSCGLHVPWNMQVLTMAANRAKGNRL